MPRQTVSIAGLLITACGVENLAPSVVAGRSARTAPPSALSDGQVLTAALKSRGANRIHALWGGDTSGHGGDQSAAEIALANHLAWWCAGDEAQVGRLMDTAPLCHRDKWAERPDYRARTVRAAVQGLRDGGWDGPTRRQAEEWYGADEADRLFGPRTRVERVNGRTRVVVAPEAGKGLQSDPEASYGPVAPTPQPAGPLGLHAGADGYALTDLGNAERLIARAEGRIAELERKIGQQALEIDFLKGCLQRIEEQRMLQAVTGNPRSTARSKKK